MVAEKELTKKQVTTFVLCSKGDSGWVLKGTEKDRNPITLSNGKSTVLPMRSIFCLGDKKGYEKTMYFEGATSIFENDVYVDASGEYHSMAEEALAVKNGWIKKLGLRSLYKVDDNGLQKMYAQSVKKNIHFQFGKLMLDKYGDDPTLQEFVMCHEFNINAPNAKFNKRNRTKLWEFHSLQEEKIAEQKLGDLDAESDAINYVAQLRTKTAKGYEYTQANENKINATLRILDINIGFNEEDLNQKHLAIHNVAKGKPIEFITLINGEFSELRKKIITGIDLNVLELPKKGSRDIMMVTGENEKTKTPDKQKLISCKSDEREGMIEELSIYFLLNEGTTDYRNFTLICDAAKSK